MNAGDSPGLRFRALPSPAGHDRNTLHQSDSPADWCAFDSSGYAPPKSRIFRRRSARVVETPGSLTPGSPLHSHSDRINLDAGPVRNTSWRKAGGCGVVVHVGGVTDVCCFHRDDSATLHLLPHAPYRNIANKLPNGNLAPRPINGSKSPSRRVHMRKFLSRFLQRECAHPTIPVAGRTRSYPKTRDSYAS